MANTHPANLGDVLKHLMLCEALAAGPQMYIESHAGAYSYDLADVADPGPGGIWDFARMAAADPVLADSAYARIALSQAGTSDNPGTYLGSVALADELLAPGASITAAETNRSTADALNDALARSGRPIQVMGQPFEGQDVVARTAGPGTLALIDPFDVHETSALGTSSIDAFCSAAQQGAATYLWYPLIEPEQGTPWVQEVLVPAGIQPLQLEIRYPEKAAGLWGCGLIAIGIPPKAYLRSVDLWSSLRQGLVATGAEYEFSTMG